MGNDNDTGEFARRFHSNTDQAEYWNTKAGPKWVRNQEPMDQRMMPLTVELLQRAGVEKGQRVLDVGCGGGATTVRLAERVGETGHVLGIDISQTMLQSARERCADYPWVQLENVDAQVHDFDGQAFDLLVSRFGVMFFADPYAAFANLRTALRPDGRLQFVCWAGIEHNPWFSLPLETATRHLGPMDPVAPRSPGPLAFSDPDYVKDILGKAGFRNIEVDSFKTHMSSTDTPESQADLYLELGPAARLVADRNPDPATVLALRSDLVSALRQHHKNGVVSLGATVQYVSACR